MTRNILSPTLKVLNVVLCMQKCPHLTHVMQSECLHTLALNSNFLLLVT